MALTLAVFETSWTSTTDPLTVNVTSCLTDDWLFVIGGSGQTGLASITAIATTTTAGSTTPWIEPQESLNVPTGESWITSAVAQVTADGTVTVQVDPTKTSSPAWGFAVIQARESGGLGSSVLLDSSAAKTVTMTVQQGSAVFFAAVDNNGAAIGTAWTPATNVTEVERQLITSAYTVHAAYWESQGGSASYGYTGGGVAANKIIALEILPSATPITDDPAVLRVVRSNIRLA